MILASICSSSSWRVFGLLAAATAAVAAGPVPATRPAPNPAATAAPAPVDDRSIVVMISLDGLAAYYLYDPKADVPTLRALAAGGARASGMRGSTPTVTWPSHTTLVTGDEPARHGVVGNNYWDRAANKKVQLISDPLFDKDQIVKVPTIYDAAKAAGMRTAGVRWPASRNAKSLDWQMPDVNTEALLEKYSTPELVAECKAAGFWNAGEADAADAKIKVVSDDVCASAFDLILRKHRPQLALLHLIDVDHVEHFKGPKTPDAYAAVAKADRQVKAVWDVLRSDYAGRATLVVVSDHGFSPIERAVLPNVVLRNAGLIEVKGQRVVGGPVRVVVQGGAAMLYVSADADRPAVVGQIRKAFEKVQGVQKVVASDGFAALGVADPKADPHAPDVILFAEEGYTFGDTAAGALTFQEKPERKGTHGHDRELPDLHATFLAWGRGIKPGVKLGEVRNIDVAPTLAALLGVELPETDGKPMREILAK